MTPTSLDRLRAMGRDACYKAARFLPESLRRQIVVRMADDFAAGKIYTAKRAYDLAADAAGHAACGDVPPGVRQYLLDAAALAEAIGDAITLASRQ